MSLISYTDWVVNTFICVRVYSVNADMHFTLVEIFFSLMDLTKKCINILLYAKKFTRIHLWSICLIFFKLRMSFLSFLATKVKSYLTISSHECHSADFVNTSFYFVCRTHFRMLWSRGKEIINNFDDFAFIAERYQVYTSLLLLCFSTEIFLKLGKCFGQTVWKTILKFCNFFNIFLQRSGYWHRR